MSYLWQNEADDGQARSQPFLQLLERRVCHLRQQTSIWRCLLYACTPQMVLDPGVLDPADFRLSIFKHWYMLKPAGFAFHAVQQWLLRSKQKDVSIWFRILQRKGESSPHTEAKSHFLHIAWILDLTLYWFYLLLQWLSDPAKAAPVCIEQDVTICLKSLWWSQDGRSALAKTCGFYSLQLYPMDVV